MDERGAFYKKVVNERIQSKTYSISVCGGGSLDKKVFKDLGFQDVTISNLDIRVGVNDYAPLKWKFENAEALSFPDKSLFPWLLYDKKKGEVKFDNEWGNQKYKNQING
jgi:hypothetical protein